MVPALRIRSVRVPDRTVDQLRRTGTLRRARAHHHGGAAAMFIKGFDGGDERSQAPVGEMADTADGVAGNAAFDRGAS